MSNPEVTDTAGLYKKLYNFKSELTAVIKKSKNPFFKSNYADLNEHLNVVEPLCLKHGLVLTQPIQATSSGQNIVSTVLTDVDTGLSVRSSLSLPALDDMQKLGGAITYARRYTLSSAAAMKAEDDDANFATGKVKKTRAKSKVDAEDF